MWALTLYAIPIEKAKSLMSRRLMATENNRYEIVLNERTTDTVMVIRCTGSQTPAEPSQVYSLPSIRQSPYSKKNQRKQSHPILYSLIAQIDLRLLPPVVQLPRRVVSSSLWCSLHLLTIQNLGFWRFLIPFALAWCLLETR